MITEEEKLLKWASFIETGHLHAEKLSHEIFYVLTALIMATWAIANRFLTGSSQEIISSTYLYLFSMILAIAGLFLIHRLQRSVQESHLILNRIRTKIGIQHSKVQEIDIFPIEWERLDWDKKKTIFHKEKKYLKSTDKYSWWAVYKVGYALMIVISVILICHNYGIDDLICNLLIAKFKAS